MPRVDLNVPFDEKDEAKRLGARWDAQKKVWFVPDGMDAGALARWIPKPQATNVRSKTYFILTANRTCWKCDRPTLVFGFGLPVGYEILDDDDADNEVWRRGKGTALPYYIEFLSEKVQGRMKMLTPHYRPDFSKTTQSWYWMNHCEHCGMKQGDFELYCEPDVAFMPMWTHGEGIQVKEVREPFEAYAEECTDGEFLEKRR